MEKQRKRVQQKDKVHSKQPERHVDKAEPVEGQILNLDLKSLQKTRKSSKEDAKASYATLKPADQLSHKQVGLSSIYVQGRTQTSNQWKTSEQSSISPKFKELTLNQEELKEFQPYENRMNRTPASSRNSVGSAIPTQIFTMPES